MSKQISLTTITAVVLSACCTTLSQGATPLESPQAPPLLEASSGVLDVPSLGVTAVSRVISLPELAVSAVLDVPAKSVAPSNKPVVQTNKSVAQRQFPQLSKPRAKPLLLRKKSPLPVKPRLTSKPTLPSKRVPDSSASASFNRPYISYGVQYTPLQSATGFHQRGEATWYSKSHQGQPTVNGEIYDVYGMTAAHPTLPIPSYARVTNLGNHKSVVVRINDRGPFNYNKKIIDLSYSAASKIGMVGSDNRQVEVVGLESERPVVKSSVPMVFNFPLNRPAVLPKKAALPTLSANPPLASQKRTNHDLTSAIYVQLGAFKTAAAAQVFMQKMRNTLGNTTYPLNVVLQDKLHRVRLGSYPNLDAAKRAAGDMTSTLGFKPLVKQSR